jgi:hypothetical protein
MKIPVSLTLQIVKERIWLPFCQKDHPERPKREGPQDQTLLSGGDNRARTGNLRRARAALSQLSYIPKPRRSFSNLVGLDRFELSTSRLSGVRSNQLSYRP